MTTVKIRILRWLQVRIWDMERHIDRTLWRLEEPAWRVGYAKRWGLEVPDDDA